MKDPFFYKLVRPLLAVFIRLYRPLLIGKNNIPKTGRVILAGNHTSYFDPLLVALGTKRCVHYFAKDSLMKGIKKPIFKGLGIIPVNRQIKDKNSLETGIKALNSNLIVGIFPEGTIGKEEMLPFKFGAVKMAQETDSCIIPFAIKSDYRLFRKSVKIAYGKPYKLMSKDLEKENKKLRNKVINLLERD